MGLEHGATLEGIVASVQGPALKIFVYELAEMNLIRTPALSKREIHGQREEHKECKIIVNNRSVHIKATVKNRSLVVCYQ